MPNNQQTQCSFLIHSGIITQYTQTLILQNTHLVSLAAASFDLEFDLGSDPFPAPPAGLSDDFKLTLQYWLLQSLACQHHSAFSDQCGQGL
jgi:hypothetical protein